MGSETIDLRTLSYELFELTGQKLYELYDFVVSNPLIIRLIQNTKRRQKKRKNQRKASRQETLSRRKVVYRDVVPMDEDDPADDVASPGKEKAQNQPNMSSEEQAKLKNLEDELARLRSEMAKFLSAAQSQQSQQQSNDEYEEPMTPQKMVADPEAGFRTPANNKRSIPAPPPPPMPSSCPAPPPPPPPMPSTPRAVVNKKPVPNIAEDKENNENAANSKPVPGTPMSESKPSLAELVRNASQRGSLRRVDGERSPGGTLKRKPSERAPNSNNHNDVIAHALRMKFKSLHRDSPISSPDKTFDESSF